MATSIFFTESKDFKLIKDRVLNHEDNYLVYVYADTTNVRIPKELIMQLPKYGNNLIWVDTADMDASDLSHHIVLTIGQLINPEEEIDFYIVSKSSKLEKTILFLRNQGIPAEMIAPEAEKVKAVKTKGTGRRGRPKKVKDTEKPVVKTGKRGRPKKVQEAQATSEGIIETPAKAVRRGRPKKVQAVSPEDVIEAPKKKRGRPALKKAEVAEVVALPSEPKKRGRKKIEKPEVTEKPKRGRKPAVKLESANPGPDVIKPKKAKKEKKGNKGKPVQKGKKAKDGQEVKGRKQRVDKEITAEMVQDKLNLYATSDTNLSVVLGKLFGLKKVARPKFEAKLIDFIKRETLEDDTIAEHIVTQLQEMQVLESASPGGRIFYKD